MPALSRLHRGFNDSGTVHAVLLLLSLSALLVSFHGGRWHQPASRAGYRWSKARREWGEQEVGGGGCKRPRDEGEEGRGLRGRERGLGGSSRRAGVNGLPASPHGVRCGGGPRDGERWRKRDGERERGRGW